MREAIAALLDLGGPVILVLLALSVLALGAILYKIWQFGVAGVGRHAGIEDALRQVDGGDPDAAADRLLRDRSHLAPLFAEALSRPATDRARMIAEAETRLARIESGFRLIDSIAQVAPLLGLFGTVLGMIDAFRALQEAGQSVDPSALAGGIWVALLTTAAGLAIAMPTTLALTWLEGRAEGERLLAARALEAFCGRSARTAPSRMELADAS